MFASIYSASLIGLDTHLVRVEAEISSGLPAFHIVGLPRTSVQECRERVRSAIRHSGYPFPFRRIAVNLLPTDLQKEGQPFDLPIALAILAARRRCSLRASAQRMLDGLAESSGITARSYHGVLRVARTIADLVGRQDIEDEHVAEAVQLRSLDQVVRLPAPRAT